MRKFTLLFVALMGLGLTGLQAQDCATAKKACASTTASAAKSCHGTSAAAKLASLDESIDSQTNAETGEVSFVRKEACPVTGKVTLTSVNYDSELGKFVNVSPSGTKECCDKDKTTGCCSDKGAASAKGVKASLTEGKTAKSCCASGKQAQCAGKSSKVAEVKTAKVKMVKAEKGS